MKIFRIMFQTSLWVVDRIQLCGSWI